MYNTNKDKITQEEYNKIVDQYTKELKNSEYQYKTAKEIIMSGIRGWRTRITRRIKNGQDYYRQAKNTAKIREKKKLLAREVWYKEVDKNNENKTQEKN